MKKCKNCKYWDSPCNGYLDGETKGVCELLNDQSDVLHDNNSAMLGLVEGCLSVHSRCDDFQFITQENFGCIHFKKL
jgi:hypothetical protein